MPVVGRPGLDCPVANPCWERDIGHERRPRVLLACFSSMSHGAGDFNGFLCCLRLVRDIGHERRLRVLLAFCSSMAHGAGEFNGFLCCLRLEWDIGHESRPVGWGFGNIVCEFQFSADLMVPCRNVDAKKLGAFNIR